MTSSEIIEARRVWSSVASSDLASNIQYLRALVADEQLRPIVLCCLYQNLFQLAYDDEVDSVADIQRALLPDRVVDELEQYLNDTTAEYTLGFESDLNESNLTSILIRLDELAFSNLSVEQTRLHWERSRRESLDAALLLLYSLLIDASRREIVQERLYQYLAKHQLISSGTLTMVLSEDDLRIEVPPSQLLNRISSLIVTDPTTGRQYVNDNDLPLADLLEGLLLE